VHAFAQQLLNRLMFLYFVQKKGWLRWNGEPDPHYLRSLWERYRDEDRTGDGGFHGWTQALFLDAFNNRRAAVAANPVLPDDVRASFLGMPFLNGGLFERNELDDLGFSVPDEFFVQLFDRFEREEPGFLERYNFTVDESTPLDVEVAVDPEMLGKVYESLVAEEERHAAGIFYTPREEIDYMCRLSLIEYLHEQTGYPKDDLIPLVVEPRRLLETPEDGIVPFGGLSQTRQHEALRVVEKALREIRVVDPAAGSGSFLVGMMKALAGIQQVIAEKLERKRFNEFDLKRRIIMENLYGVDVKDWAVRACELRLWLSLTIEAEEQQIGLYTNPVLPKLSFRVRQGDSLVEEVAGVPLAMRGAQAVPTSLPKRLARLAQEKADFFGGRSLRKPHYIEREEQKLLVQFFNQRIDETQRQIDALRRQPAGEQLGLEGMAPRDKSKAEKEAEVRRQARIRELEARHEALIKARTLLTTGKTPPFFVWDVGFGEVFAEKGGFDICIGNPPYVRQEEIGPPTENPDDYDVDDWRSLKQDYKDRLARGVQALWGGTARLDRKSDLYVYFYYAGLSLLREGGVFCFINSNSWLDVDYGAELQEFLLRHMRIRQIIDNQAERSFAESEVNTVIVLLQRPPTGQTDRDYVAKFVAYKKSFEEVLSVLNLLTVERASEVTRTDDMRVYPITQLNLYTDGAELLQGADQRAPHWTPVETLKYQGSKWGGKFLRAPDIFFTILEKAIGKLVRLGDIAEVRRGFTTGANEFFYLDEERIVEWEIEEEFLLWEIDTPRSLYTIRASRQVCIRLFMCHKSPRALKGTNALRYIKWGEERGYSKRSTCRARPLWYDLGTRPAPIMIWPRTFFERHICYEVPEQTYCSDRFYGLSGDELNLTTRAFLNSTLVSLQVEINGYHLNHGGIDTSAWWLTTLPVMVNQNPDMDAAYAELLKREIDLFSQERLRSDRCALDEAVFRALDLPPSAVDELYEIVEGMIVGRIFKARREVTRLRRGR
jgi:hypothetical protein